MQLIRLIVGTLTIGAIATGGLTFGSELRVRWEEHKTEMPPKNPKAYPDTYRVYLSK